MLIAIATDGGCVSPHFGRCETYTLVKIENGKTAGKRIVNNPGHAPGAIPEFLKGLGTDRIVCGGIGGRAIELFGQYGIEITAGVDGNIDDVVGNLAKGTLRGGESSCKPGGGRGFGIEKTECDHAH